MPLPNVSLPPSITLPNGKVITFGAPDEMIKQGMDQSVVGSGYGFYIDPSGELRRADDPGTGESLGYVGREYAGQTFANFEDVAQAQPNNPFSPQSPSGTPPPSTPIDNPNDPFWKGIAPAVGISGVLGSNSGGSGAAEAGKPLPLPATPQTDGGFPRPESATSSPSPNDRPSDDPGFIQWWLANQGSATPEDFTKITQLADSGNPAAVKALTDAGYVDTGASGDVPLEQGILNQTLPGLVSDIDADAGRRALANELGGQLTDSSRAATTLLNRTQGTGSTGPAVNVEAYLRARPDLAQNYQNNPSLQQQFGSLMQYAIADFNANRNGSSQFPKQWYDQFAQSSQLSNDFANADQTVAANIAAINQSTATQLQALGQATAAMQGNLTGDLATRAAALQQQIATLLSSLDKLDSTQRAALTKQVTDLQANLDQSITTQRQALETQIAALRGAADTQAVAQRDALTKELAGLTAAQAPLAEARTRAAELQGTAVNAGLQSTTDQLRADAAREGFVGGSTMQDAALARAAIDARQQAAQALGQAQLANASDTRDIAVRGASGERTIAEALAQAQHDISGQGATGNADLTKAGATGLQQINDFGANGEAALTGQTAQNRAGIEAQGANTTFQDKVFGADQQRQIADALAQGTYGITGAGAAGTLAAQQQGTAAKATYYDNDFNRALAAQLAIPGVVGSTVQGLTALGDYGQSGLKRTQGLLSWWQTPTNNPPTPEAGAVQPSTSGADLSKLGASLFGAAAQNWWK